MKKAFLFLGIFCMAQVAWGDSQSPFKVQISIDERSLNTNFYTQVHRFYLNTTVKNISDKDQEIVAWTQYGWSWTSNNAQISPGKEALQNFPTRRALKPGQEYSQEMEMMVDPNKTGPITFRLGFMPRTEKPMPEWMDVDKSEGIVWSNEVILIREAAK